MEIVRKQKNIFSTFGELKAGDTFIARLYNSDTETTEDYCVCVLRFGFGRKESM